MKLRRSANENSTRATGKAPKLSREWMREIERRVRDSEDPVRYMLVSEYSRSFILYYNVSDDMFTMNVPERGTLFKRRQAAENVGRLLSRGIRIVRFTTKGGRLKRLSPFKGSAWARENRSSRSRRRAPRPATLLRRPRKPFTNLGVPQTGVARDPS